MYNGAEMLAHTLSEIVPLTIWLRQYPLANLMWQNELTQIRRRIAI